MSSEFKQPLGCPEGMPQQFVEIPQPDAESVLPITVDREGDRATVPFNYGSDEVVEDPADMHDAPPHVQTEIGEPTDPNTDVPDTPPVSYAERHNTLSETMDVELPSHMTVQELTYLKTITSAARTVLLSIFDDQDVSPPKQLAESDTADAETDGSTEAEVSEVSDTTDTQQEQEKSVWRYRESQQGIRETQIRRHYETVEGFTQDETDAAEDGENLWSVNDSPLVEGDDSMNSWFVSTLPEGHDNIKEYAEAELADVEDRRALEAGGTGRQSLSGFGEGFFSKTVATNLTDTGRANATGEELKARDLEANHTLVLGNMTDDGVKEQVATANDGQKFDVIIERMYGGIVTLPGEPFFVARQAADYYNMLSDRGMMFMQVPASLEEVLQTWSETVTERYPGLEVQLGHTEGIHADDNFAVIRIQKREGAPEHLPLFDARAMVRWQRQNTIRGIPL